MIGAAVIWGEEEWAWRAEQRFRAARTINVPVMIEVFRLRELFERSDCGGRDCRRRAGGN